MTENFLDGFILLSRSLMDSNVFQNEKWLKVWIWCLLKANHKKNMVPITTGKGQTVVEVNRGQFIFGRHKAAEELKMNPSTVRNIMDKLKKLGNLDMQKDSHYTLISICNYSNYQNIDNYKNQAKGQAKDNQRTGKGQPKDTNNNDNNVKNDKKEPLAGFDVFWKAYPKKKSKGQAEKAWLKISPSQELFISIMEGLEMAKNSQDWEKEDGKYIPHPSTWLNAKGWEDEYKQKKERKFA